MIEQFDNIISPNLCDKLISLFLADKDPIDENPDDQVDLFFIKYSDKCRELENLFYSSINSYFSKQGLDVRSDMFELSDSCIFESSKGRPDHFDNSFILKDKKMIFKPIVFLVNLNDNFSGGEIIFNRFNYLLPPKKGSLVVFPANFLYTHYVSPTNEPRYILRPEFKLKEEYWFKF